MKHISPNDMTKPSFIALSFALRNESIWPNGFKFDYGNICHCAIGLGSRLWSIGYYELEKVLHAENKAGMDVFVDAARKRKIDAKDVTPSMVADDIDALFPAGA